MLNNTSSSSFPDPFRDYAAFTGGEMLAHIENNLSKSIENQEDATSEKVRNTVSSLIGTLNALKSDQSDSVKSLHEILRKIGSEIRKIDPEIFKEKRPLLSGKSIQEVIGEIVHEQNLPPLLLEASNELLQKGLMIDFNSQSIVSEYGEIAPRNYITQKNELTSLSPDDLLKGLNQLSLDEKEELLTQLAGRGEKYTSICLIAYLINSGLGNSFGNLKSNLTLVGEKTNFSKPFVQAVLNSYRRRGSYWDKYGDPTVELINRSFKPENLKTYKHLVESGFPITPEMIKHIFITQEYPFMEFVLSKMEARECYQVLEFLKLTEDSTSFEIVFNKDPKLGEKCSFERLKNAVLEGRSIFVSEMLDHGMKLTQEQFKDLFGLTVGDTYNLPLIKKFIQYAGIHGIKSPSYPEVLDIEKSSDITLRRELKSFALHSPLEDIYELVRIYPKLRPMLEDVLQTISLAVRLPNRTYAGEVNPAFEHISTYTAQTGHYVRQNKKFLDDLPSLFSMSREEFLDKVVQNRYERLPVKDEGYIQRTSSSADSSSRGWSVPSTCIRNSNGSPSRYHWSLRHLTNLLYNPTTKNWEKPEAASMSISENPMSLSSFQVGFKYAIKTQDFLITRFSNETWYHNQWIFDNPHILKNHLNELHTNIVNYHLDMRDPENKLKFFEMVARGYWLTSTLCEYGRGTPHNSMMWLNAIYRHHHLPPPIPKLEHFFLDNTMLMLPIEEAIVRWESFFEPPFQEYLREAGDAKTEVTIHF